MKLIKELSVYDLDNVKVYDNHIYETILVPEPTKENMLSLVEKINELVKEINQLKQQTK